MAAGAQLDAIRGRLRDLAQERRLAAAAADLGLSRAFLSRVAHGQQEPSAPLQRKMAERLNCLTSEDAFNAVRAHQLSHADFTIEELRYEGSATWDGTATNVRTYRGLRPTPLSGPLPQLVFRERSRGRRDGKLAPAPKLQVIEAPGVDFTLSSTFVEAEDGAWHTYRVVFPDGWNCDDGGCFSFSVTSEIPGALVPPDGESGRRGIISNRVLYYTDRLVLAFTFPRPYKPEQILEPWAWYDSQAFSDVLRNLAQAGSCRALEPSYADGRAQLVVSEPLRSYVYAIVWESGSLARFNEARDRAGRGIH